MSEPGLPAAPGSYVLVLRADLPARLAIGSLGELEIRPGYYLYTGSAFGPGGLRARAGRHLAGRALLETSDDDVSIKIVGREDNKTRTFASLKEYAVSLGIAEADFGAVLKLGGWTQYAMSTHDTMEAYLQEYVAANNK